MTIRKYSSRSQQTTLSTGITSTDATATVVSGANLLSSVNFSIAGTFTVVIDPDTALEEIVDVTGRSGNVLDISRGIENGGTGVAHSAGAVVRHMVTGRDLQEANDHIKNETTAHGLTIANVVQTGTTGTVDSAMILDGTIVNADINASAAIADTKLATISTASKVSNSATTATSANTASAIVARDASGNFTAGTVTADLTGNVTGTASAATLAASATALATPRAISLTGDITATGVNFDGTAPVVLTTAYNPGSIVNADIDASAAISYSKLDLAGTITSSDIANGTIVDADINASAAITMTKLATNPIPRANHTGTQLASTISDFDTQVRTSRLDQMAAPTSSVAFNAQKITGLADPTLAQDAATKAYTDTQITNLINAAPGALDTLDELAAALGDDASFSTTVTNSLAGKLPLAGGTMTGALVLSGAPTIGLHAVTKTYADAISSAVAADAATASAAATAAASSYDSFDDRYLGAKASNPSVDNDGNALVTGALYWNTTDNSMKVWSGSAWGGIQSAVTSSRWSKTAAGGETTLNGADNNSVTLSYTVGYEQVYLNGVLLVRGDDYTASTGSSITGISALTAGDIVEVLSWTPYSVANALTVSTIDAKGDLLVGTASDTIGRLAVGTDTYVLTADSTQTGGIKWSAPAVSGATLSDVFMMMGA